MKTLFLSFIALLIFSLGFAQSNIYEKHLSAGDSLFKTKQYKKAGLEYAAAFNSFGGKGRVDHRYKAAQTWALAEMPDSAFLNLNKLVKAGYYGLRDSMKEDATLKRLHRDKRWTMLLNSLKLEQEKAEAVLDKNLVRILDTIYDEDQKYRLKFRELEKKFSTDSKEIQSIWDTINRYDNLNLIKVKRILDERGWLGSDVIGKKGSSALFLVIQHADQKTREIIYPNASSSGKTRQSPTKLACVNGRSSIFRARQETDLRKPNWGERER